MDVRAGVGISSGKVFPTLLTLNPYLDPNPTLTLTLIHTPSMDVCAGGGLYSCGDRDPASDRGLRPAQGTARAAGGVGQEGRGGVLWQWVRRM